jgi:hypothetical protein
MARHRTLESLRQSSFTLNITVFFQLIHRSTFQNKTDAIRKANHNSRLQVETPDLLGPTEGPYPVIV